MNDSGVFLNTHHCVGSLTGVAGEDPFTQRVTGSGTPACVGANKDAEAERTDFRTRELISDKEPSFTFR